jgi:Protein of unknown function (DUF433)
MGLIALFAQMARSTNRSTPDYGDHRIPATERHPKPGGSMLWTLLQRQRWWLAGPGSVAQDSGLGAALVRTPGAYVDRMSGLPCIPDTRVTVSAVLGQLAAGRTIEEILVDYPYLDRG